MNEEEAAQIIAEGRKEGLSPVQALRQHKGLSREALAEATGVSHDLIALFENSAEIAQFSADNTAALARYFGITDDLLFSPPTTPQKI
jgi:transcriptional regulator with XRE-family HTH domain